METLFAIGMLVGLWKANAEPPKVVAAVPPVEQRQITAERPKPRKPSEWLLGY